MFGRLRSSVRQGEQGQRAPQRLEEGTRRLHMVFSGQVQGVGFRWTAQIKARNVGATGWVQNERDGTVTMELQGTDEQISRFFGEFGHAYARYPIDYVIEEKREVAVREDDTDFEVHFAF